MASDSLESIFAGLTLNGPSNAVGQSPHTPAASEFDMYGEESDSIIFRMAHTPAAPDTAHRPLPAPPLWAAILAVKCDSLARLMTEGFSWSAGNLMAGEAAAITDSPGEEWVAQGFRYSATWIVVETPSQGAYSRWVGRLQILSPSPDALASFEPRCLPLPLETIVSADAWNATGAQVYHYDRDHPHESYNLVRGGVHLAGWWPGQGLDTEMV